MDIQRKFIQGNGYKIPSVFLTEYGPTGAVVIVHGYGGSKEEQMGLAWRVAEMGFAVFAIDLHGHGEHPLLLTEGVLDDVEAAIRLGRAFGKVAVIGHSLGGRLALLSSADLAIALSPAFSKTYSLQTHESMKKRSYRVRESSPETVFELCEMLPEWEQGDRPTLIIYGSRDIPEIVRSCEEQKSKGVPVTCIDRAMHSDIYLSETTFEAIGRQLSALAAEDGLVR